VCCSWKKKNGRVFLLMRLFSVSIKLFPRVVGIDILNPERWVKQADVTVKKIFSLSIHMGKQIFFSRKLKNKTFFCLFADELQTRCFE
jgi:hypothetical protein